MRWTLLIALLLVSCAGNPRNNCDYGHCEPDPTCEPPLTVPLISGSYTRTDGGAPEVVGGIQGIVTADLDVETGILVLQYTRQSGEEVEITYDIDEIGTAGSYY